MRWAAAFMILSASAGWAAPPPRPAPLDAQAMRAFVKALETKKASAYSDTLADDLVVKQGARIVARGIQWMRVVTDEFSRRNRVVKIEGGWAGIDTSDRDAFFPTVSSS